MKVTSGMTHPLAGTRAWQETPVARAPRTRERQPAAARPLPGTSASPAPKPAARRRTSAPTRARNLTVLSLVASATLLGCASIPSAPWRLEPTYRIANGGGNTAQGYLALARQYEGEQRSALALDAYQRAAEAAPGDADVQNLLGLALAQQAQFGAAVTALRRAVALAPDRAPLLNNLGYALLLDGRAEESRAMFRLTLAVQPSHEMAGRNLAHADGLVLAAQAAAKQQPVAAMAADTKVKIPAPLEPVAAVVHVAEVARTSAVASVATLMPLAPVAQVEHVAPVATVSPVVSVAPIATASPVVSVVPIVTVAPVVTGTPAALDGLSVEIVNGMGVRGAAARIGRWLRERGVDTGRLANLTPYKSAHTLVLYKPGMSAAADEIARRMPMYSQVAPAAAGTTRADVRVLLGHDLRSNPTACATLGTCALPSSVAMVTEMQSAQSSKR